MTDHLEESAELYALGALDELEIARVQQHVRTCRSCAARVAEAEEAIAEMAGAQALPHAAAPGSLNERLQRSLETPRAANAAARYGWIGAIAAALVLGFVPAWFAARLSVAPQMMAQDQLALAHIAAAGTAVDHAQFMAAPHRPMDAKVLYGPHGDWYYVVVMHPRASMHVAYVHGGHMEMLGSIAMQGESGTLYLPVKHKMDELALLEGDRVVASAHLVY